MVGFYYCLSQDFSNIIERIESPSYMYVFDEQVRYWPTSSFF